MKKLTPIFLFALCLLSAGYLHAAPNYLLIDLGTMGNDWSYATSINNNGIVAGVTGNSAFKWARMPDKPSPIDSTIPLIDTRPLGQAKILPCEIVDPYGVPPTRVYATSINDNNEIVGGISFDEFVDIDFMEHAIMWDNSDNTTTISTFGRATDINNLHQVLYSNIFTAAGNDSVIFDSTIGKYTVIASSSHDDIDSISNAINDMGQAVGQGIIDGIDLYFFAFLWEDGTLHDLNTLAHLPGPHLTRARDINNSGQIIGSCEITNDGGAIHYSSFLFSGGQISDLGFRGANAINDNGQIVGSHYLYDNDGKLYQLYKLIKHAVGYRCGKYCSRRDISTYTDLVVKDINNQGQIVGSAIIEGAEHAVLLTPISKQLPSIKIKSLTHGMISK